MSQSIILEDETPSMRERRMRNKSFRDVIDPETQENGSYEIDANAVFKSKNVKH